MGSIAHLAGLDDELESRVDGLGGLGGLALLDGSHFCRCVVGGMERVGRLIEMVMDEGSVGDDSGSEEFPSEIRLGQRITPKCGRFATRRPPPSDPVSPPIPSLGYAYTDFSRYSSTLTTRNATSDICFTPLLIVTYPTNQSTMASALVLGLGTLGAGFAGLTAMRMLRGARGADKFLKGGFKAKMDRSEAISILGLR